MKNATIAFEFIWDETPLLVPIAKQLSAKGLRVVGVIMGERWKHLLKDCGLELVSLSDYLKSHWDAGTPLSQDLAYCDQKYGIDNDLAFFLNIDRLVNDVNAAKFPTPEDKKRLLVLHVKFWEDFFARFKPRRFYSTGIAFMPLLIGSAVARKNDVRFMEITTTRDNPPRIAFVDNQDDSWVGLKDAYTRLLGREITPEERNYSDRFLSDFRQYAFRPAFMKISWLFTSISPASVKEFYERLIRQWIHRWGRSRFDYVTPPLWRRAFKELKVSCKRQLLRLFFLKTNPHPPEKPFALFGLQCQPEEPIDIHARWYANQIATIENIAKVLPLTHTLVVKEHTVGLGKRPGVFSYYQSIAKLNNVELAHPLADSHELIKKADVLILTTGTLGWEGLLYGKPVVLLGNAFYRDSGLALTADNPQELKQQIRRALNGYKPDETSLHKFVVAVRESSRPGHFNVPHMAPELMAAENIDQIADAIAQQGME